MIAKLKVLKWKFLLQKSWVFGPGKLILGKDVSIKNCKIYVSKGSVLEIGKSCNFKNVHFQVNGKIKIGEGNIFDNGDAHNRLKIVVQDGSVHIGVRNRMQADIRVRFGARLEIGDYNNVNEGSEIRADESVSIGSFNQISYRCVIWDTNTHNIYSDDVRRKLTIDRYPTYGFEFEKPKTSRVCIGDDCWIGREVSILKGVNVGDSCVIGYRTLLASCNVDSRKVIVTDFSNKIFDRITANE